MNLAVTNALQAMMTRTQDFTEMLCLADGTRRIAAPVTTTKVVSTVIQVLPNV